MSVLGVRGLGFLAVSRSRGGDFGGWPTPCTRWERLGLGFAIGCIVVKLWVEVGDIYIYIQSYSMCFCAGKVCSLCRTEFLMCYDFMMCFTNW